MVKNFIFTVGLPGSGKTHFLQENYPKMFDWYKIYPDYSDTYFYIDPHMSDCYMRCLGKPYVLISADQIKKSLEDYDSNHPERVHEESVQIAAALLRMLVAKWNDWINDTIIMDGTGLNNHYTENLIKYVREHNPETKITCLYFDTPIEVCLQRLEKRERKVPINAIYEKNIMITSCLNRYKPLVDEIKRIDYYTNKYLLLDMDGTICGYTKVKRDIDNNADFVNSELFRHLRPVEHIIEFAKKYYDMKNVYIVTAVPNSIAWDEKQEWLDKHFPEIPKENRFFCGNKDYKHVFVKQLADKQGWERNEIVLVDDYHYTIDSCRKLGINCIHPSDINILIDDCAVFS